jgi:hypothetical protein
MELLVALGVAQIGAIAFAGHWLRKLDKAVDSYASEKGKNLATREDIEVITRKIESVKADFELKSELRRQVAIRKIDIAGQIMAAGDDLSRRANEYPTEVYLRDVLAFGRLLTANEHLFSDNVVRAFRRYAASIVIHGHNVRHNLDPEIFSKFTAEADQIVAVVRADLHGDE